jgi:serine/threonine protein kinase/class 3 adenylate cyclase
MRSGKTLARRYELEREIGRGTTGSVWVALDSQLGRRVAVKMLNAAASHNGEGLVIEAKTIALLRSPHVVQVFDVGFEDDQPFIVMELLQGETLETRLLRHRRLPLRVVTSLVTGIAKGLAAIHDAGILHRDLKPANVFLAQESGKEVPKLLDFGVAVLRQPRELDAHLEVAPPAGTPLYMSPEHFSGSELDERSDLWSLAVVTYEMLMGSWPFLAQGMAELRAQVCSGLYQRPSAILQKPGAELDILFDRAFATERSRRFSSATAMVEELLRIGENDNKQVIRVLFLDDEPDMQLLLERRFRSQLRDGSYELHFATDGQAGLDTLRQRPDIDVVLTDLNMPGMDGLTFLSHLPSVNPLVKAVVVTAYNDMDNIRTAMNHGAFDFLCKPIDFNDLQRTIHKCAEYVGHLRSAVDSREQNSIFRVLLGQGVADKIVTTMRASEPLRTRNLDATVAFVHICGLGEALEQGGNAEGFALVNSHFEVLVAELLAHDADVSRFLQDSTLAVFEGDDHLVRAVEACLAIRRRLRTLASSSPNGMRRYGVAIGLDAGPLIAGLIGSLAFGRLESAAIGSPISIAGALQRVATTHDILISGSVERKLGGRYPCHAVENALPPQLADVLVSRLEEPRGHGRGYLPRTRDVASDHDAVGPNSVESLERTQEQSPERI